MSLHVTVAGWLLGPPSGANRRLLALLAHLGAQLATGERITVLHRRDFVPEPLPGIDWAPIAIPAAPTWRRVRAERRLLAPAVHALGATLHDHGFLPLPHLPIPSCLLVHDVRTQDGIGRWPRWLARAVLRRSCERAAAIVVPSEWTAARVRTFAPNAPTPTVIVNGVAIANTPATPLPKHLPRPERGYVLHVGHIEARKNLTVVVHALARLAATQRPELWLAGHDAGALGALTTLAAHHDVPLRALGVVDETTLASLYTNARHVVVPSHHEGFGLPALEALAHGRTVLVSDAGALPEVTGPLAQPLAPDDIEAWRRALTAAPLPVDEATRTAWLQRFRWESSALQLLALWRRLHRAAP